MTTPPDDMHAREPIDRVAQRVVSTGVRFESRSNLIDYQVLSETPLPIRPLPKEFRVDHDLTGKRVGWLVVLGLSLHRRKWVCRCHCGRYTLRSARALSQRHGRGVDRCGWCEKTRALKKDPVEWLERVGRSHDEKENFDRGGNF